MPHRVAVGHAKTSKQSESIKAISASGAGRVDVKYDPEAADKSTKIVFIQVMRELLDGVPAKPSESDAAFAYQDADTTKDFHHVDYVAGEADPYYNGDDASDFGTQGNATGTPKIAAAMNDTPHFDDANFPGAKTKIRYEFRDAAFSAAGPDAGTYYQYADWTYEKQKGVADTTAIGATHVGHPGRQFVDAVRLWNSNHSFTMPGEGHAVAGAVTGALGGAVAGAVIGSFFGPIGTLVGGLLGAVLGGIGGAVVGSQI